MPLEFMGRAPYAPASAILAVITQHRKTPIAAFDTLVLDRQVGISESLIPRTLVALQLLELSDDDNNATPEFTALARVPESELKSAVADILRRVYEPVISSLGGDLSAATPDEIAAAFRSYNPLGQLDRMVQLFTGLMAYVGMMPEVKRRRGKPTAPAKNGKRAETKRENAVDDTSIKPRVETPASNPPAKGGYSRSVPLAGNAGTVTLSGTIDPFALTGESRTFFFAMIDLMADFEALVSRQQKSAGRDHAGGEHA